METAVASDGGEIKEAELYTPKELRLVGELRFWKL
jgi:hypothetical protein